MIRVRSIGGRLTLGFASVIVVFCLASGLAFVALDRLRHADAARDTSNAEVGAIVAIEEQINQNRLLLGDFLLRGDAAARDRFLAARSGLAEALVAVPGVAEGAEGSSLTVLGDMAVAAITARAVAEAALSDAVSGLASPVAALAEVAARAGVDAPMALYQVSLIRTCTPTRACRWT